MVMSIPGRIVNTNESKGFLRVPLPFLLIGVLGGLIPSVSIAASPIVSIKLASPFTTATPALTSTLAAGTVIAANASVSPNVIPPSVVDTTRLGQRLEQEAKQPPAAQTQMVQKEKPAAPAPSRAEAEAVKFKVVKVVVEGSTVYTTKQLAEYYTPYLGKTISLADLQKITDAITARYRKDGYILSRAVIPAQKIQDGELKIKVVEGYISQVYIEGDAKGARAKLLADAEKIKKMRPLQIKQLERYMLLLNDLPGLVVKSVLAPSADTLGAAELTFITEQKKLAANVSYDNRGTRYMGPQEVIAMLEINDPLHLADHLVLQTVDTPATDELRFVQALYNLPLGSNGWKLNLSGNLAETNSGFILDKLDLVGRSKDWSVGLEYPVIRTRDTNLLVHGKFEWLDTNTDFTGINLFEDHIRSVRVGASYGIVDNAHGFNAVNADLSKGLHVFGASPLDPSTPISRYHGRSDYTKVNADVSRLQAIGSRYSVLAALTGQYSFNQPLLSAEQFGFGGTAFGRGYDSGEVVGDAGVAGKLEFRIDTAPDLYFLRQLQYYVFYDAGAAWNVASNSSQSSRASGTTTGGGLRGTLNKYFYGNFEVAKPLTRPADTQVLAGRNGNAWRFYFGLGVKI